MPSTHRLRPGLLLLIDCLAAALLAVAYQVGARTWASANHGPHWPVHLLASLVPLPIAVRRLWPTAVLGAVLVGSTVLLLIGAESDPLVAVALALYMTATRHSHRRAIAALVAVLVTVAAVALTEQQVFAGTARTSNLYSHVSTAVLVVTAAWTTGYAVRQRRAYLAAVQEQATRRARAEIAEERLRIARDMHDIVAHSMSLIAVQAGVANYVIGCRPDDSMSADAGDPAVAEHALASIEGTSRAALTEMRRLLGALRDVDGARRNPVLNPTPELADLDRLVAATTHAGVRVDLRVEGRPRRLPVGVEVAAYRIVQEALTNVIEHAGADTGWVVVSYEDDALALEISDNGRGGPVAEGHGITGMRERTALFGGTFEAAALPDRGFKVAARLPFREVPA